MQPHVTFPTPQAHCRHHMSGSAKDKDKVKDKDKGDYIWTVKQKTKTRAKTKTKTNVIIYKGFSKGIPIKGKDHLENIFRVDW